MNIGIDLDGVVFDTESAFRSYSQIYDLKIHGQGVVASEELLAQKRFNWTSDNTRNFFKECLSSVHTTAPVFPYARAVLKAIAKRHKIIAITNRGNLDPYEIEISNKRLEQEDIKFDQIVYHASNKLNTCRELGIDLMIDDLCDTISTLAVNGFKCFYFRDTVLKNCKHANITEVRNWGDIANELLKLQIITIDDIKDIQGTDI